jgi:hypothetical protein
MPHSQYLADATLDWFLGTGFPAAPTPSLHLSIHSVDPGPVGVNGDVSAVVGTGRKLISQDDFSDPGAAPGGGRQISNTAKVVFSSSALAGSPVTYFGIWDAATGGNLLTYGRLSAPITVLTGDIVEFPVGQLIVRVPIPTAA